MRAGGKHNVRGTQGCGETAGGVFGNTPLGLLVLVLYVWKELRVTGLFCLCFWVCMKLEQLQSESSGDKGRKGSSR